MARSLTFDSDGRAVGDSMLPAKKHRMLEAKHNGGKHNGGGRGLGGFFRGRGKHNGKGRGGKGQSDPIQLFAV